MVVIESFSTTSQVTLPDLDHGADLGDLAVELLFDDLVAGFLHVGLEERLADAVLIGAAPGHDGNAVCRQRRRQKKLQESYCR